MSSSPFPDVRWGSERSILRKPLIALSTTRLGSWLIRKVTPLDRHVLLRSKGRLTMLGPIGLPTLLLTTTGRKSGLPRTTPLLYYREGDTLFVVGSNFGQAHHPAWTGNLLTNPQATVTVGGRGVLVRATQLTGPESDRVFAQFVHVARTYSRYRDRTTRQLRIFALEATAA
jgi:deazaflavin-dependent oxidoreductase (nitroreductase family)